MGKRNISANVHLDSMVINVNVSVRLIYHKLQFSWLDFFNFLNKEISCYMEASMGIELVNVVNCTHLLLVQCGKKGREQLDFKSFLGIVDTVHDHHFHCINFCLILFSTTSVPDKLFALK